MQLSLTQEQIDDLAIVRDLGGRRIAVARESISACHPILLRPRDIAEAVRKALGDDGAFAGALIRLAVSLQGLARGTNRSIEVLGDALRDSLQGGAGWDLEQMKKWAECEPEFLLLIGSDPVRLAANAIDLSYEYANLYRSGRILTDIRPLFDEEANCIEASVIAFTLRLRYQNLESEHDLSIAMDEEDVVQLAEQCARALRKAQVAKALQTRMQIPTFVTGEGHDG